MAWTLPYCCGSMSKPTTIGGYLGSMSFVSWKKTRRAGRKAFLAASVSLLLLRTRRFSYCSVRRHSTRLVDFSWLCHFVEERIYYIDVKTLTLTDYTNFLSRMMNRSILLRTRHALIGLKLQYFAEHFYNKMIMKKMLLIPSMYNSSRLKELRSFLLARRL
jgi:hypothetical protein